MKPKAAPRIARWHRASYQQHVDCEEAERRRREVRSAFWAQRYRPLDEQQVEEEEEVEGKNKKEQYKHLRKNVGKALRSTWKCLMLGLYNLALCYSTPTNVVATFVPDFSPARNRP
ncbi:uncharacterized protein ACBT44_000059 [Syngnathus typhle]